MRLDGELSHSFSIDTGVLQGDTLAPFLFVIMVDYIMRLADKQCTCHDVIYKGHSLSESTRSSSRATVESVKHPESADDIVTCFDAAVGSQQYLSTVETIANSVGLYINHKKTEYNR